MRRKQIISFSLGRLLVKFVRFDACISLNSALLLSLIHFSSEKKKTFVVLLTRQISHLHPLRLREKKKALIFLFCIFNSASNLKVWSIGYKNIAIILWRKAFVFSVFPLETYLFFSLIKKKRAELNSIYIKFLSRKNFLSFNNLYSCCVNI